MIIMPALKGGSPKRKQPILRIWYNQEWYYDLDAIKENFGLTKELIQELQSNSINFTLRPFKKTETELLVSTINGSQILKILKTHSFWQNNNQPYSESLINEMYEKAQIKGNVRFSDYLDMEREGFFSGMGKIKEDFLSYIEGIIEDLSINNIVFIPARLGFEVYETNTGKHIDQLIPERIDNLSDYLD